MKNRATLYIALPFYFLLGMLFLLFTSSIVDPSLIYHTQQPAFLKTSFFLGNHLGELGGVSLYLAGLLMQLYYYSWLGSVVLLAVGGSIAYAGCVYIRRLIHAPSIQIIIPAATLALILMLNGTYLFHLAPLVSVVLALGATNLMIEVEKRFSLGFALTYIVGIIVYWATGGMTFLLYCMLMLLYYLLSRNIAHRIPKAIAIAAIASAVPYLSYLLLFPLTLSESYLYIIPTVPTMLTFRATSWLYLLLGLFPSLVLLVWTVQLFGQKVPARISTLAKRYSPYPSVVLRLLVVMAICIFVWGNSIDKQRKAIAQADYFSYKGQWENVIEVAQSYPGYNFFLNFHFNRAHLMLGTIGTKVFNYPQRLGVDALLPDRILAGEFTMPASDIYYDLGYIPASLVYAGEVQTLLPYSPRVIERTILNNLVLGNYSAARTYMNTLEQIPFTGDFVSKYKPYLNDTALVAKDKELMQKRALTPTNSLIEGSPDGKLRGLLSNNPDNERARDYLVLHYIMEHNLGEFMRILTNEAKKGITTIPRIWEEAIMVYMAAGGEPIPEVRTINIDPKTLEDFREFSSIIIENHENMGRARIILKQQFKDTYWYYVRFESPKVTGAEILTR